MKPTVVSRTVLAQLVLESPGELELALGFGEILSLRERRPHLLLEPFELGVAVGQLADDRPARGLFVGPELEVPVLLEALQDHPGEIEDPVGGDLHEGLPPRSSSENGWRKSCSRTSAGSAATSAPIRAASSTWMGLRA